MVHRKGDDDECASWLIPQAHLIASRDNALKETGGNGLAAVTCHHSIPIVDPAY